MENMTNGKTDPISRLNLVLGAHRNLNQYEVATAIGVNESVLSRVLNRRQTPSAEMLAAIEKWIVEHESDYPMQGALPV
jgi:transcriptional regulator with XRE-family HTH domain